MVFIKAYFFGRPVFLKITKGMVESPSKARMKSIITSKSMYCGVLKATASSCRKIRPSVRNNRDAPATLRVAVEMSFRVSWIFSAKRKKVVSIPCDNSTIIIPATE